MKVILIKDDACRNGAVCWSGRKLIALGAVCFIALPLALGLSSYWVVSQIDRALNPFVDPEYRIAVETRVNEQQEEMLKTREYVRQHMDVLGRRIGSLQAQVSRIKAVEMRIAETSGVNLSDFEFEQDPPIGGASSSESDSEEVDIENAIREIEKELSIRESEIAAVDFLLSRNNLESQQTPAGWPVKGGWVSSSFGSRMHPMTGKKQFHRGVDIPGKPGALVLAVADGVVVRSEKNGNYGWMVEIDHGDSYTTLYGHNRKNLVKVGETVVKGQGIAEIGSTGRSTGPHVHFEVAKDNRNINPVKYLYKKS
ncbi:M23 family metallopeptidase [Arenicella chitinivorans]|uniref:M23 family metallopeptidase n=1 Tax=Arenicella chitinivorans TaxID=1329800 RepID=UPI00167A0D52|nr:M23 family metallopeptidase [Arenicella chitinivorans]